VASRVGRRGNASNGVAAQLADGQNDSVAAVASTSTSPSYNSSYEYVVGPELDGLLARGQTIEVVYPIRNGRVRDWDALLALCRHVLHQRLSVRTAHNDCPLLVSFPPTLSRDDIATATRLLFENFNVPSLSIAEEPLLSAYAAGSLTTTVVDFGWEHCTVSPVMENVGIVHTAVQRSDVGMRHVALYLAHLLGKDESVVQALIKLDATRSVRSGTATPVGASEAGDTVALRLFELAIELIRESKLRASVHGAEPGKTGDSRRHQQDDEADFDIAAALVAGRERAAIEEQERKNRLAMEESNKQGEETQVSQPGDSDNIAKDVAQKGASDEEGAETVTFQGIQIRVGPTPLIQACEPLWDPSVLLSLRGRLALAARHSLGESDLGSALKLDTDFAALRSVPDTIASSIGSLADVDRRPQLWEALLATGAPTRLVANMNAALVIASQDRLASNADSAPGTTAAYAPPNGSLGSAMASAGPNSRDSPGVGGDVEGGAQPTTARCIKTPDYFAEFKDRTDLAPFLGATIYAKVGTRALS
jgi:actin-related protein 9